MATARLRILIVDDNTDTARMMKVLLKRNGYDAKTAHDGPEALEVAGAFEPDVVLLDQRLPGMSGAEVAGEIRALPGLGGCVPIAVSGYDAAMLGSPSPFAHHFKKPVDHGALLDLLSRLEDPHAASETAGVQHQS